MGMRLKWIYLLLSTNAIFLILFFAFTLYEVNEVEDLKFAVYKCLDTAINPYSGESNG